MIRWAELRARPVRTVAGLMTGTSMDGLDIALCRVTSAPELGFELLAFETVPLPKDLRRALAAERLADLASLARADAALGLSALGVPLIALIVGLTGSIDGVLLAMAGCSVVAFGVALILPRGAPAPPVPAIQPAE